MAKRVNTKFVVLFGAGVIGVVGLAYVARKVLIKPHPEQFKAAALDAEKAGRWQEAIANWNKAVQIAPNDPELLTDRGMALHQVGMTQDPTIIQQALDRRDWQRAMEINPNYLPAVEQLRAYWEEQVREQPSVETAAEARKWSKEALRLAPDDPQAPDWEAFLDQTIINGWIGGQETDEALVKRTESDARALMAKHPELPELPLALSSLEIHRGQQIMANGGPMLQPAAVTACYNQAAGEIQGALKLQPKNAMIHFDAAQVFASLSQTDRSSPTAADKYRAAAAVERKKAMELVQPTDPHYADLALDCAMQAYHAQDETEGKAIVAQLLKTQGSDPTTVMRATPLIRVIPELRAGAIASLQSAYDQGGATPTLNIHRFSLLMSLVQLQLADLEDAERTAAVQASGMSAGASTRPANSSESLAELKKVLPQRLALLAGANLDPMDVARCQGQYALIEKDWIGAIQLLTRAIAVNKQMHDDFELNWELATAFGHANERQQARDYCEYVVGIRPMFLPARKMLVELLSGEGSEEARRKIAEQMNFLQRVAPDDPEVIRLQIAMNAGQGDQGSDLYNKLPEDTAPQLISKAAVAVQTLHKPEEAVRLLKHALLLNPGDVPTVEFLVEVDGLLSQRTAAMAVVEGALQVHPTNVTLQYMLKQLEKATPEELRNFRQKFADQGSGVGSYLQKATEAMAAGNYTAAEEALKAAEKIEPMNKDVLDRFFRLYVQTKQWDKVDPYVKKLADINYDQAHGLLYQFELARGKGDAAEQMRIATRLISELPEFAMSYYCMGQAYQANGKFTEAIANYDTAMAKKGVVRDAAVMLRAEIDCYYQMNRPDRALVGIAEGRRRYPDDPEFLLLQIHHELNHGDPKAAVTDLEQYLKDHPDLPDAYLDLASARMRVAEDSLRTADPDSAKTSALAARDLMKQAMEKFPDDSRVYSRLSEIVQFGGDLAGAEKILLTLADRPTWKKEADPQAMLGKFYATTGQLDKAEAAYAKALSLARDNNRPVIRSRYAEVLTEEKKFDEALTVLAAAGNGDAQIMRQRINVMVTAGRYPQAEDAIRQMLAQPGADVGMLQTGWAQLEMALNKRDSAVEHVALALAADPKCVAALVARAKLKTMQTPPDLDGAMADLNTARLVKPDDVDTLLTMADVYMARNNAQEADRVLEAALRQSPGDMGIRFRLAYTLSNYPPLNLDEAMQTLQEGRGQMGGERNPDLCNNIAAVYEQKGDLQSAIKTTADALNQMPGNPTLIRSYLRLLLEARQWQPAKDAATTVLNSKPDVWWALEYRGRAKANLGDKQGGLDDLTKALDLADKAHDIVSATGVVGVIADEIDGQTAIDLVKDRDNSDPNWKLTLIMLYHRQGQDNAAVPLLDQFMAGLDDLTPPKRIARLQLAGMIYADAVPKPYSDKAYAAYKQLLVLSPNDIQALNNFACLCADDFTPPKAEEGLAAIKRAIDLMSSRGATDPLVDDTYGWLMILSGQTSQGMDVVKRALANQSFPEGYYHLAEGYLRLNRPTDAQQQVALALDEIAKDQQSNRPVSAGLREKVENLSNRVLDILKVRTSGSVP